MRLLTSFLALAAAVSAAPLEDRAAQCTTAPTASPEAARAAFTASKIVSDLIPTFSPTVEVKVDYKGKQAQLGNVFRVLEVAMEPSVSFTAEEGFDAATTRYTIIMADPDAPGPKAPILGPFLHSIISDAQPSCLNPLSRKTLAPYMAPTPLSIAQHRYVYLVYRQPKDYTPPPSLNYVPGVRARFDLAGYVAQAGLEGPVGGNFYRVGLDSATCGITAGCTQDGTDYEKKIIGF